MPNTVLGAEDTDVNKIAKLLSLKVIPSLKHSPSFGTQEATLSIFHLSI